MSTGRRIDLDSTLTPARRGELRAFAGTPKGATVEWVRGRGLTFQRGWRRYLDSARLIETATGTVTDDAPGFDLLWTDGVENG